MSLIFEKITASYHQSLPFVCFKKPKASKLKAYFGENTILSYSTSFKDEGFLFAPFNNEKKSIVDLLETAQSTKTDSMNSNLYYTNQYIIPQNKYFTSTTELAVRKKLLKNWAATIRNDIVERTLELKLRSDVRISLKISRTGEILNIKTIGVSVNNESIKNFINVIRTSGKFPMAPRGLKLDYVTFPVNFRSRG